MARTELLSRFDRTAVRRRLDATAVRRRLDATDMRGFARSSPARLIALGLVLLGLCLLAGAITSAEVGDRQHALAQLLDEAEPDANSAQRLYTSLSVADAAAGTAFISGGLEPKTVRDRYDQAVGEAAAELVAQSSQGSPEGTSQDTDTRLRTGVATELPVYTGLIETARANNREGHPVGAAYLSEASNLMQTRMLSMAQELQEHRSAAIAATQHRHVRPPWAAIILPIVALGALVAGQFYLARRWHRVLNPGLLAASGMLLLLLAWTVVAGSLSAVSTTSGRDDGAVPGAELTESRILAQQARSAETLKLVRRDASGDYDHTFDTATARLDTLLSGYPGGAPGSDEVRRAHDSLARWRTAHQRMNDALGRGDFPTASAVAIGSDPSQASAAVDTLDKALAAGISDTRDNLRGNISDAARSLDFLTPGALALAALAAALVVAGLWPRLREYR
ncbi:putative membrane protein [Nocardia nova SH22a]|uniref:Putative membrane protein n=1 Tax=Nocardia nova SH22a TaxID=1415166 RepID=W5TXM3_9NOCA|nr:hypothetical protein [Nocardia nova]AHH21966.1 putative membrane protein [Nocardia nova SH22a]